MIQRHFLTSWTIPLPALRVTFPRAAFGFSGSLLLFAPYCLRRRAAQSPRVLPSTELNRRPEPPLRSTHSRLVVRCATGFHGFG